MITLKCDICKKEITEGNDTQGNRIKWSTMYEYVVPAKDITKAIKKESVFLCPSCRLAIANFIKELKDGSAKSKK